MDRVYLDDMAWVIFTIVITALITSLCWAMTIGDQYEEAEKEAQKDVEEYNKKIVTKKIAGHKAAFTKTKKHYEIAKKIIRRGRNERLD